MHVIENVIRENMPNRVSIIKSDKVIESRDLDGNGVSGKSVLRWNGKEIPEKIARNSCKNRFVRNLLVI